MQSMNRLICLTLPLLSLLFTQACVDDQARSDKKKLQKQLAEQERQSADLLKEKADMEAQKSQLELDAAQDVKTIADNEKKIEDLNKAADANATEIKNLKKANESLKAQVESKTAEAAALQKDIDALEKQLKERDDEIKAKSDEINRLTNDLAAANTNVDNLTQEVKKQKSVIAAQEKTLTEKTEALTKLEAENATLREGDTGQALENLRQEVAALKKELEAARTKEQTLSTQLTAEQKRTEELSSKIKTLDAMLKDMNSQTSAVQVFLANAGKDSLFVLEPDMVRETYNTADDENCTFIFNINRTIDVLRGPARDNIPGLNDRTMLPLKGGYQKVAVCQKGEEIRAQVENGSIYQSVPNNNNVSIQLVSARETSSCDSFRDDENNSPFASKFQLFYPYRGHIDGIETIDLLRPNNDMLRYNMASSTFDFRGMSCAEVVKDGMATDLSVLACRLALGQETGATVTLGCFKEVANNGKTELSFQAR